MESSARESLDRSVEAHVNHYGAGLGTCALHWSWGLQLLADAGSALLSGVMVMVCFSAFVTALHVCMCIYMYTDM